MTQTKPTANRSVVNADADRFHRYFTARGAIRASVDSAGDEFSYIDESKCSAAMVSAYQNFMLYRYANGLA